MIHRRDFIRAATAVTTTAAATAAVPTARTRAAEDSDGSMPVRFALNMATIRGHKLSIHQQIEVAARAGYDGIEPWIGDLKKHVESGGSLSGLRTLIEDSGLTVDSAIGFANWIVDHDQARAAGLRQAREEMELVQAIGGTRVAAPPVGLHKPDSKSPPLAVIAERYRALLEVGAEVGVVPQLELWGFSPTLSKLSELAYVAAGAGHPDACVLPDFYHIYKGGNDFASLGIFEASRMHCFHINDYPSQPPRESITDKHRVFPGDGVCPLPTIIRQLIDHGFNGTFSLELFNPEYWQRDATEVASEGLRKSRQVVQMACRGAY
jgi:2-keto-myo-inositol isomerase